MLTATTHETGLPVLNSVHLEVGGGEVVLTATDRYRLATRTLVPIGPGESDREDWAATLDADELRLALPWSRRQHELRLGGGEGLVSLRAADAGSRECRTMPEPFPDYRQLLASLPAARTRVLVARNELLRLLEEQRAHRVRLDVSDTDSAVTVSPPTTSATTSLAGTVTGPAVGVDFALTTLHPAISTAVGPDVLLEIASADQPVVVRSADCGDLTTLVMPLAQK